MFSVAPNILLAPNMTQNAERKHRTQDANTAHNQLRQLLLIEVGGNFNTLNKETSVLIFATEKKH